MFWPLKRHSQGITTVVKRSVGKCDTASINIQLCVYSAKLYMTICQQKTPMYQIYVG